MSTSSNAEVLSRLVTEAVAKVFDAYGTMVELAETTSQGSEIVAVIGYAANDLRGGLAIGISGKLARATMPTENVPVYDWVGELANQILGRVRNRLLDYSVDIQIATPVVLHGLGVHVAAPTGGNSHATIAHYTAGDEVVQVLTETRFEDGYEFPEPTAESAVMDEGEMMFF